jgi:hypothetical protein
MSFDDFSGPSASSLGRTTSPTSAPTPNAGFSQPRSTGLSFNQQRALQASSQGPPIPRQRGTQITEFGRADFDAALVDWNRVYNEASRGLPQALELIERFSPGGGFGEGLREESRELIGQGVARDTATAVATGGSSMSAARGLNTLAGRETAKAFAGISDTAAQLELGATSLYQQMLNSIASVGTARPTSGQFISRITTPDFSRSGTTIKQA